MSEDHEIIEFPGLEDALVGVAGQQHGPKFLIYSVEKIMKILEEDMTHADAIDYFECNIRGLYAGPGTPFLMEEMGRDRLEEVLAGES